MSVKLENFKPKLRPGRMIPHGSKFTFQLEGSSDRITLPMIMADFVLLSSGQYTIREIVEKIYRKQGTVPFRAIVETLYNLHSHGFIENSHELREQPWLAKQQIIRRRLHIDIRTDLRIVGPRPLFAAFYLVSLAAIVASIYGLIFDWQSPFATSSSDMHLSFRFAALIYVGNSLLLTGKHMLRALQTLLLNGSVSDIVFRISPWGCYFATRDGVHEGSSNLLFTLLFHVSQILVPFAIIHAATGIGLPQTRWIFMLAFYLSFWELSPFRRTDFFNLLRLTMLPHQLDSLAFVGTGINPRNHRFILACGAFGIVWVSFCFKILASCAQTYGGMMARAMASHAWQPSLFALLSVGFWLGALFFTIHSLVETTSMVFIEQVKTWRLRLIRRFKASKPVHSEKWVVETMHRLPLFAHLSDDGLQRMVSSSKLVWIEAGTPIIVTGDPATHLFVLFEGSVVIEKGGLSAPILPVTIFGESALVEGGIRGANVLARERSLCLKVSIQALREVARDSGVIGEIDSFMTAIMVDQFFASAPLFRKLPREGVDFLSSRGVLEYVEAEQTIFKQGDPGEYFYMVIRGSVQVKTNSNLTKTIPQGGFFGEISLIANIPRTATLVGRESTVLFKISADAFWEVLVQHMEMAILIESVGEQRLQEDLQMMTKVG